jgi:hypothetical protein
MNIWEEVVVALSEVKVLLLSCLYARGVTVDVGFICGKAAILGDTIKRTRRLSTTFCGRDCSVVFYIHVTVRRYRFLFNNQPDAIIIKIYSVIKLYMFRAASLPIFRSFPPYIRHW